MTTTEAGITLTRLEHRHEVRDDEEARTFDVDQLLRTYAYSYPHKSAYRPLQPAVPLADVWADEDVSDVSLYVHLPFCEMRCGFCNLFAQSQPRTDLVDAYLDALNRQAAVTAEAIPHAEIKSVSLGDGTPTWLKPRQLTRLFELLSHAFSLTDASEGISVETSPATATTDRLTVLRDHNVRRISLGEQSFIEQETQTLGRPQRLQDVLDSLDAIRDHDTDRDRSAVSSRGLSRGRA